MKKVLKYYWYVSKNGWNYIYDTHLHNLSIYMELFDEAEFIISFDCGEVELKEVEDTINKIKVLFPNAKFTAYQNDKNKRESKYFYEEIEKKLGYFDKDTAIFFAHNKGVDTSYVSRVDCTLWIDLMYYCNLRCITKINELLNNEKVCAIGHYKMYYPHWNKCKNNWHFPGTYFWIVPSRVKNRLEDEGESIPDWFDRYSAEGFLGSVFAYEDDACVGMKPPKDEHETVRKWAKENFNEDEKKEFSMLYGDFFTNRAALDIFVFAHKPFNTERTNPVYKIVTSSDHNDITNDSLPVLRLNCQLSNIGFSEWQKIFELFLQPKNLKDYVGLAHFHRYLKFSDDINFIPDIDEEFNACDCIGKIPCEVGNLRYQYELCHNIKDYDIMMQIIAEEYPDFAQAAITAENRGLLIDSNILILRKEDFLDLCDFVFSVLLKYCKKVGIDPTSDESFINYMKSHEEDYAKNHLPDDNEHFQQARICSFLAERLVIIYLTRRNFTLRMYDMVEK